MSRSTPGVATLHMELLILDLSIVVLNPMCDSVQNVFVFLNIIHV